MRYEERDYYEFTSAVSPASTALIVKRGIIMSSYNTVTKQYKLLLHA